MAKAITEQTVLLGRIRIILFVSILTNLTNPRDLRKSFGGLVYSVDAWHHEVKLTVQQFSDQDRKRLK